MKKIRFPDGYVGNVSDTVAAILLKKNGHSLIEDQKVQPKPDPKIEQPEPQPKTKKASK